MASRPVGRKTVCSAVQIAAMAQIIDFRPGPINAAMMGMIFRPIDGQRFAVKAKQANLRSRSASVAYLRLPGSTRANKLRRRAAAPV